MLILGVSPLLLAQNSMFYSSNKPNGGKATLASDNFTQGDEDPLSSSGKWHLDSVDFDLKVVSHTVVPSGVMGTGPLFSQYYIGGVTWPNDQFVQETINLQSTASEQDIGVTCRDNGMNTYYSAFADYSDGTFVGTLFLRKTVASVTTSLATMAETFINGQTIGISCQGTTIKAQLGGSTILTATDNAIASGNPGILMYSGQLATEANVTAWSGGACNGAC